MVKIDVPDGFTYEEVAGLCLELVANRINGLAVPRVRGVADHLLGMSDKTARSCGQLLDELMDLSQGVTKSDRESTLWTPADPPLGESVNGH